MNAITRPGIYDLTNEQYHADPCPEMSLSSSGARDLLVSCPAKFMASKQLPRENKRCFDIGSAGHLMVLEPHLFDRKICEIKLPDWRTNVAKKEREAAYAAGLIPLLSREVEEIRAMHSVIWRDSLAARAFSDGKAEQSMFWQDKEFGIWCRLRPDYMPNNAARVFDYKTAADGSPDVFMREIYNRGYHQQAAWYLDGYEAVTGHRPREFWFVVQEKTAPFLLSFFQIDEMSLEIGRTLNRQAKGIFAWCLRNNRWPGYQPEVDGKARFFKTSPPAWLVREYEFKNEHGAYEPPEIKQKEVA